jgi:hypothetical protein
MSENLITYLGLWGALIVVLGQWLKSLMKKKTDMERREKERDHERSKAIQTAADRARQADDAGHVDSSTERLFRQGRLRD